MKSVTSLRELCELAVDPFMREAFLVHHASDLARWANASSPLTDLEAQAIAQGPWAPCTTCSDPGPDEDVPPPDEIRS